MAHFIKREPLNYQVGSTRRIYEECSVAVGALPDDTDRELIMVLMREPLVVNHERVLRLTIGEAMILQRNLGHAIDDLQKRNQARRQTSWERLQREDS